LPGSTITEFQVTSPDAALSRTYTVNTTLSLAAAYNAWAAVIFPAGTAAALTAPAADFDWDGIANIMEYLTGSRPATASTAPLAASVVDGMLEIRWSRRSGMADGVELLQGASSLTGPWTAIPLDSIVKTPGTSGNPDVVTLRLALTTGRYFMRLAAPPL
jgi:hypothetical protein